MANNRLIAVCIHADHRRDEPLPEMSVMKYYPSSGWYPLPEEPDGEYRGTAWFFAEHLHGGSWGNYIVFVPEVRGLESLHTSTHTDTVVALLVSRALHGTEYPN